MKYDVVIIGAGPAGLTAALYTGRAKLKTRILEKHTAGGQILLTNLIENFPGIYQMDSFAWVEVLKKQLKDLNDVEFSEEAWAEKLVKSKEGFEIHIRSSREAKTAVLQTRSVLLSCGAQPKKLGIKGEQALTGRGVSYCATCDGPLFRDKEVVVVGGGETALEEAIYLTRFAKTVILLHRRSSLRGSALMQERVRSNPKIRLKLEFIPKEITGSSRVEGFVIEHVVDHRLETLACDGVFVFVGFIPDTRLVEGVVRLNEVGSIITDENLMTSQEGIFACGDCRARPFHQVVTACSEGAIAAFSATKYLEHTP